MKGLDDYITGIHIYYEDLVKHECPKCHQVKDVPMHYELGGWFYDNDDAYCNKCQTEMEAVKQAQAKIPEGEEEDAGGIK